MLGMRGWMLGRRGWMHRCVHRSGSCQRCSQGVCAARGADACARGTAEPSPVNLPGDACHCCHPAATLLALGHMQLEIGLWSCSPPPPLMIAKQERLE